MHGFHHFAPLSPYSDVRLIGDDHIDKPGFAQPRQRFRDSRKDFQLLQRFGWVGFAVADYRPVDDAIAIQKDCTLHAQCGPTISWPSAAGWGATPGNARRLPGTLPCAA